MTENDTCKHYLNGYCELSKSCENGDVWHDKCPFVDGNFKQWMCAKYDWRRGKESV